MTSSATWCSALWRFTYTFGFEPQILFSMVWSEKVAFGDVHELFCGTLNRCYAILKKEWTGHGMADKYPFFISGLAHDLTDQGVDWETAWGVASPTKVKRNGDLRSGVQTEANANEAAESGFSFISANPPYDLNWRKRGR